MCFECDSAKKRVILVKEVDMKETIEAIYENGVLRLLKKLSVPEGRRIRVTLESLKSDDVSGSGTDDEPRYDFSDLAGCLRANPHFSGDPVTVQRELRDEWS